MLQWAKLLEYFNKTDFLFYFLLFYFLWGGGDKYFFLSLQKKIILSLVHKPLSGCSLPLLPGFSFLPNIRPREPFIPDACFFCRLLLSESWELLVLLCGLGVLLLSTEFLLGKTFETCSRWQVIGDFCNVFKFHAYSVNKRLFLMTTKLAGACPT